MRSVGNSLATCFCQSPNEKKYQHVEFTFFNRFYIPAQHADKTKAECGTPVVAILIILDIEQGEVAMYE